MRVILKQFLNLYKFTINICVVIIFIVTSLFIDTAYLSQTAVAATPSLYISNNQINVVKNEEFTIQVKTNGVDFNAAQIDIKYDPSVLSFKSFDVTDSILPNVAVSSQSNGIVKLAIFNIKAVTGDNLKLASFTFSTLVESGNTNISIADSSSVQSNGNKIAGGGSSINVVIAKPVTTTSTTNNPQSLSCKSILILASPNSPKQFDMTITADAKNGATITAFNVDYGDTNKETVTSGSATVNATHTYTSYGTFTVKAIVKGTIDGAEYTTPSSQACTAQISIPDPSANTGGTLSPIVTTKNPSDTVSASDTSNSQGPSLLPATGIAGVATLFGVTSILGAIGHSVFTKRRLR